MIARLLICPSIDRIREEVTRTLHLEVFDSEGRTHRAQTQRGVNVNHPDLLCIQAGEKLGIAEARKIKEHFSLKPYSAKGRVVVLEDASTLTDEAQNALLKTIEELPREAILILGASSSANLLPTILSRCNITNLEARSYDRLVYHSKYTKDLEILLNSSLEERFEYIEKLKEREEFLHSMVYLFRQKMIEPTTHAGTHAGPRPFGLSPQGRRLAKLEDFLKELLRAEKWAKQNVNIRAILEYLMLVMPSKI